MAASGSALYAIASDGKVYDWPWIARNGSTEPTQIASSLFNGSF